MVLNLKKVAPDRCHELDGLGVVQSDDGHAMGMDAEGSVRCVRRR